LRVIPSSNYTSFSDVSFARLAHFRLGLPLQDFPSSGNCTLCGRVISDGYYAHPMCCSKVKRAGTTIRHNWVLHVLNKFARLAGASTSLEPRAFVTEGDGRKPDLSITHLDTMFTDVVITQPDAPSKRSMAPVKALQVAETAKVTKYAADLRALGHSFLAAAATSHGVLSTSLRSLVAHISGIYHSNFPGADRSPPFEQQFLDELLCAIQKGNARILRDACNAHARAVQFGTVAPPRSPAAPDDDDADDGDDPRPSPAIPGAASSPPPVRVSAAARSARKASVAQKRKPSLSVASLELSAPDISSVPIPPPLSSAARSHLSRRAKVHRVFDNSDPSFLVGPRGTFSSVHNASNVSSSSSSNPASVLESVPLAYKQSGSQLEFLNLFDLGGSPACSPSCSSSNDE
jgi:hypothetical protein